MSADGSTVRVLLRPGMLALHVFAVAVVVLTVVMGSWQWQSYDEHRAVGAQDLRAAAPVPLTSVLGPDEPLTSDANGRTVNVSGRFAGPGQQVLVDERADGSVWVVRPFQVDGSAVLVVLGATEDAGTAPIARMPDTTITGVLQPSESGTGRLDDDGRIGNLNSAVLVGELPTDLFSAYLVRTYDTGDVPAGLTPVEPAYPDTSWSTGLRNLVYAVQWWLFGAFGVFMWLRICRDQVLAERSATGGMTAEATRVA